MINFRREVEGMPKETKRFQEIMEIIASGQLLTEKQRRELFDLQDKLEGDNRVVDFCVEALENRNNGKYQ